MTAYTSSVSGNWSAAATWGGSGVPGNGDTVTVAAGMTVTVDVATTVGTSPTVSASAAQLVLTVDGNLAVAPGVTLTVRGDAQLDGTGTGYTGKLSVGAGATFQFDSTASSAPTSNAYSLGISNGYKAINAALVLSGTKGNRARFGSVSGGANGYIVCGTKAAPYGRDTVISATYAEFFNLGAVGAPSILFWLTNGNGYSDGGHYSFALHNVQFTACGTVKAYTTISDLSSFDWQNVTFKKSLDTYCVNLSWVTANTGGLRQMKAVVFDKAAFFNGAHGLTIDGSLFQDTYTLASQASVGFTVSNSLVCCQTYGNAAGDGSPSGQIGAMWYWGTSWLSSYYLYHRPGYVNPHFVDTAPAVGTGAASFVGNAFEFTGSDANGDCILIKPAASGTSATNTLTIRQNLVLPCSGTGGGGQSGVIITDFGGAGTNGSASCNYSVVLDQNTAMSAGVQGEGAGNVNENYDGQPNQYSSVRSNLFYGLTTLTAAQTQYGLFNESSSHSTPTTPATDEIPATVLDYNGLWNQSTGTCTSNGASISTPGYQGFVFSTGAPGAHDVVSKDPKFAAPTRNASAWAASLGLSSTPAAAIAAVAAMNDDTGSVAGATPAALLTWVRAGFAPQSPAYKGTGYGGVDIGAVAVVLPPAKTVTAVSFSPSSGDLDAGNTVSITVNLSGAVTVTGGTPTLALSNGATATYASGSGTAALTFSYVVASGHDAATLSVAASSPVSLNGASVLDTNGIAPDFSAAAGASPSGLIQIDTTAPALASVTLSPSTGYLVAGATLSAAVTWSEAVAVSGKPSLTLSNGTVLAYSIGSGSKAIVFSGTIASGQDATSLSVKSVSTSGAVLSDLAGNVASLSAAVGAVPSSPVVDTTPPTATLATSASGTLRLGDTCSVTLTMSEAVVVSGAAPTLSLSTGGVATLTSSTSTSMVFSYTVQATDKSGALSVTGLTGTVTDMAGNALAAVAGSLGVNVNSTAATSGTGTSVTLVKPSSLGSATTLAATDGLVVRVGGKLQVLSLSALKGLLG